MTAGRVSVSSNKSWDTPPTLWESVERLFGGPAGLDPCGSLSSVVVSERRYLLPDEDGLVLPWDAATIYCNPPYGRDRERGTTISDWLAKCSEASAAGAEVVALIPVATNTGHWKRFVFGQASVCFLAEPRVKFWSGGAPIPKGAPMACAVVYWGNRRGDFAAEFGRHGYVTY